MKFLIDMNLTPEWASYLMAEGHEALHWREIGDEQDDDRKIMAWARDRDHVVLTSDLDFGGMLALSGADCPSAVQLRTQSTLPESIGSLVTSAIRAAEAELRSGALLTIDTARSRLRTLPFEPD